MHTATPTVYNGVPSTTHFRPGNDTHGVYMYDRSETYVHPTHVIREHIVVELRSSTSQGWFRTCLPVIIITIVMQAIISLDLFRPSSHDILPRQPLTASMTCDTAIAVCVVTECSRSAAINTRRTKPQCDTISDTKPRQ